MKTNIKMIVNKIKKNTSYLVGIEREALRCDLSGALAGTMHPEEFGDKMENKFITNDFGEAHIEIRTEPCENPEACYESLYELTSDVLTVLNKMDEYLWPYSMPCTNINAFKYNIFSGYKNEEDFERYLANKYGIRRLLISGIHFNLSISDELLKILNETYSFIPKNKDDAYLRCMRGFLKVKEIFRYFFDATPTDFDYNILNDNSFRNGCNVYQSGLENNIDFTSKETYIKSIEKLIEEKKIAIVGELYIPIRAKGKLGYKTLADLKNGSINHIEVRLCDINPFDICGITKESLNLATIFIFCCMVYGEDVPKDAKKFLIECEMINEEMELDLKLGISFANSSINSNETLASRIRKEFSKNNNLFFELAKEYSKKVKKL